MSASPIFQPLTLPNGRRLPNPAQWQVSPVTQRLLQHWRALQTDGTQPVRPFFCQIKAVETAIWPSPAGVMPCWVR